MAVSKHKNIPTTFPQDIQPMLATLTADPVEGNEWMYELKWDGYRALAYKYKDYTEIRSRNNKSFNEKFYPIFNALKNVKKEVIFDGEIVVLNDKGIPDFSALQQWRSEADGHLVYYIFDILWLNGKALMGEPLIKRREILKANIPKDPVFKASENFKANGSAFFALAAEMGLEGIMAKKSSSVYVPGARTKDWLKIKTEQHQEAIIAGYTKNENTIKPFSALLLGINEEDGLKFIGPVGTGFNVKQQKEILLQLKPLVTKTCPFAVTPEYNKPSRFRPDPPKADVVWVKPAVVCEITYRELTPDGSLRHPSFRGIRNDKEAGEIVRELPVHLKVDTKQSKRLQKEQIISRVDKKERKTFLNPANEQQSRNINGHELKFTNLSKVYWPKENISKRDMLNYYYKVTPYILPYLLNRPQTLNRYPHGIEGEAFYQKDVKGKVPSWIQTFPYHSYTDGRDKEFIVCSNEASLLYIASLGCIEINPWSSTILTPEKPDWCIIDLDPDQNTFNQVIEAANVTNQLLSAAGIISFPKTSGSTGLHIYIPLGAKYTYEESKEFARAIAKKIHQQLPKYTSIERKTADRGGKMYIDFLQNRPQATIAAPYSIRPKPGATVSMPLVWDEVKKGLAIKNFTINNAPDRLKETGDLFSGVLKKGINIKKTLQLLETL